MPLRRGGLLPRAQMAELVDAPASGAGDRKVVEVRVLFWAPFTLPQIIRKLTKKRQKIANFSLDLSRGISPDLGPPNGKIGPSFGPLPRS